uniref:Uncharacterized protein n=1 Tax=Triticum urartu TaxID=4572 RepID=A0A8R7PRQ6_TRIUA
MVPCAQDKSSLPNMHYRGRRMAFQPSKLIGLIPPETPPCIQHTVIFLV